MRKAQGGGGVGTSWGIPRIVESRGRQGRRGANSPGPGREGPDLLSLLKEFPSGKDNFDHDGLDGASLDSPGLVPFPGKGGGVKQTEALSGSLICSVVALLIYG
jgi:hypothetical protein